MPISDPSLPLQKLIVSALKSGVPAVGGRVYDEVPSMPAFPYVRLGNCQAISEKTDCLEGAEVYLTIDAWSRMAGKVELKQIGAAIILALDDAALSDETVTINSCLLEDAQYLDDPDGITKHGVLTFHILTD
jgi:hypothetical protein